MWLCSEAELELPTNCVGVHTCRALPLGSSPTHECDVACICAHAGKKGKGGTKKGGSSKLAPEPEQLLTHVCCCLEFLVAGANADSYRVAAAGCLTALVQLASDARNTQLRRAAKVCCDASCEARFRQSRMCVIHRHIAVCLRAGGCCASDAVGGGSTVCAAGRGAGGTGGIGGRVRSVAAADGRGAAPAAGGGA